jgi:hypothetical protein
MKNHLIFSLLSFIFFNLSVHAQIKLNSSGYVKIGSTESATQPLDVKGIVIIRGGNGYSGPSYEAMFDQTGYYGSKTFHPCTNYAGSIGTSSNAFAQVWTYNLFNLSDGRYKENVRDITNALDKVIKLKGVLYNLKLPDNLNDTIKNDPLLLKRKASEKADRLGLIAQDVKEIIPEAVYHDDSTDIYGIDYIKIIPVLIEAIKEQQAMIKSLQSGISSGKLKSTSDSNEQKVEINKDVAELYQNYPNPFSENTEIEYYLPESIVNAAIYIYDMSGLQIKYIPVESRGHGYITISGNELKAGMYMYTLITEGNVTDTKRMILTDPYALSSK